MASLDTKRIIAPTTQDQTQNIKENVISITRKARKEQRDPRLNSKATVTTVGSGIIKKPTVLSNSQRRSPIASPTQVEPTLKYFSAASFPATRTPAERTPTTSASLWVYLASTYKPSMRSPLQPRVHTTQKSLYSFWALRGLSNMATYLCTTLKWKRCTHMTQRTTGVRNWYKSHRQADSTTWERCTDRGNFLKTQMCRGLCYWQAEARRTV